MGWEIRDGLEMSGRPKSGLFYLNDLSNFIHVKRRSVRYFGESEVHSKDYSRQKQTSHLISGYFETKVDTSR